MKNHSGTIVDSLGHRPGEGGSNILYIEVLDKGEGSGNFIGCELNERSSGDFRNSRHQLTKSRLISSLDLFAVRLNLLPSMSSRIAHRANRSLAPKSHISTSNGLIL